MFPVSAITGVTNATARFERATQQLLETVSGLSDDDPAKATVAQIQAKAELKASVQSLRAAQQMTAALLDIIV